MGTYLENYLEGVSSLPGEVRRNFALLRELDQTSQELIEKVEQNTRTYVKSAKRAREANPEEEELIRADLKQALQLGDEKVALAVQTYELVDKHIRKLDTDLKKFEAELEQGGASLYKEPQKVVEKKPNTAHKSNGKASRKKGAETAAATGGLVGIAASDARVLSVDMDMPIDPNEPTYCICNRVSFGEMVGCDNTDCKVEWFHFECVGLTNPPKGKWYCPDCTAVRKKTMGRT